MTTVLPGTLRGPLPGLILGRLHRVAPSPVGPLVDAFTSLRGVNLLELQFAYVVDACKTFGLQFYQDDIQI